VTALDLAAAEEGAGPPVLVLHGLFGSGRNWATVAKALAATHRVFALDLRNHGASPWAPTMSYAEMAGDVAAFIRRRGLASAALIGHSMGGKAAMMLALAEPALVERLVVVDVAPAAYEPTLGAYVRAMQAVDLARVARRSDAEPALATTVVSTAERGFLLQNLVIEEGGARWRLNLAALAAAMPAISGFPVLPAETRYDGPALFLAGARSGYVQQAHEPAIRRLFPGAEIVRIAEAGHWVHAEQQAAFLQHVKAFLAAA
jgi:esterase